MAKRGQDGEQRVAATDNLDAAQATQEGGTEAAESFEVRINPKLHNLAQVEIGGEYFYADSAYPQFATEQQTKAKDPESGLQYLVKRGG